MTRISHKAFFLLIINLLCILFFEAKRIKKVERENQYHKDSWTSLLLPDKIFFRIIVNGALIKLSNSLIIQLTILKARILGTTFSWDWNFFFLTHGKLFCRPAGSENERRSRCTDWFSRRWYSSKNWLKHIFCSLVLLLTPRYAPPHVCKRVVFGLFYRQRYKGCAMTTSAYRYRF